MIIIIVFELIKEILRVGPLEVNRSISDVVVMEECIFKLVKDVINVLPTLIAISSNLIIIIVINILITLIVLSPVIIIIAVTIIS